MRPATDRRRRTARWRSTLPLIAGAAGLGLLLLFVRPGQVVDGLAAFDARLLPLLLLLAALDYALRFWRWHLLVALTTGLEPPRAVDAAVFLAANALMLTPGRVGDWSRSVYARDLYDAPIARTMAVPLLERVIDVLLMALLALGGATVAGGWQLIGLTGAGSIAICGGVLVSLKARRPVERLIRRIAGAGVAVHAGAFFDSLRELWRPRALAVSCGLGALAWLAECGAFFVVLSGLGLAPTASLAGKALFIYPVGNLVAGLSLLPGGLGLAEGSIAGLTGSLTGTDAATAFAAALLIRATILGFGVISGLPGVAYVSRRLQGRNASPAEAVALGEALAVTEAA